MLLIRILLLLLICSNAEAAIVYISSAGSGAQDGSSTSDEYPASSLQTAYNSLGCGDTLSAKAGDTYSYTSDALNITKTGCVTADPITFTKHGSGDDPLFQGDRNVSSNSDGDIFALIADDVDHHEINNWDCDKFKGCWWTTTSTGQNPIAQVGNGNGRIQGWKWIGTDVSKVWHGFAIYGDDNDVCGPGDGCTEPPAGSSADLLFQNFTVQQYSGRGMVFRNGVGGGTQAMVTIDSVTFNGGGSTYDVGSSNQGQVGIDIGMTSAPQNTPDHDFLIQDCTFTDHNNRLYAESGGSFKQGDGIKIEGNSKNIVIKRGFSTLAVDAGLDLKGDIDVSDFVSFKNTHCIKSYAQHPNVVRIQNFLCHDVDNPGGNQTGAGIKVFGSISVDSSTFYRIVDSGFHVFKLQDDFGNSNILLTDTVYGSDSAVDFDLVAASCGSGINDGDNDGIRACSSDGNSQSWIDTDVYAYCHDGESESKCGGGNGTDPAFNDPDEEYDNVNITGVSWDQTAFADGIGWEAPSGGGGDPPPETAPDPPTSFTATADGSSEIDLSWTEPVDDGGSAITNYIIDRESPKGGGFAELAHVDGEDLTNQGFEGTFSSGVGASWSKQDVEGTEVFAQETSVVHSGSNSQLLIMDNGDEGIQQHLSADTVAGASCTATAWVYVSSDTASDVRFNAKQEGGDYTQYASDTASVTGSWELLSLDFTKEDDSNDLRIAAATRLTPAETQVTYFVDDVSVVCGGVNTTTSDTGLTAATQYNYRVKAENSVGTGSTSNENSATTAGASDPGDFIISGFSASGVTFK